MLDKYRVLIVEDDEHIAEIQKLMLENYNYNIIIVSTGKEAIELLNSGIKIDIILMDIFLDDDMNGIKTAEKILSFTDIPIMFLSSCCDDNILREIERVTSYGYILKGAGCNIIDASIKMALKLFQANNKIKQSEEKYRQLFENINDAVFVADADTGMIVDANKKAQELSGYSLKKLQTMHHSELHPAEDKNIVTSGFKETIKKGVKNLYNTLYTADKKCIPVSISSGSTFKQGTKNLHVGVFHDITYQKEAESAMMKSEERFRLLIENVSTMAIQGYADNGETLYWNKASENLYGFTAEEAIGKNIVDLIIPSELKNFVKTAIEDMAKTGIPIPAEEIYLMHKNGSRIPVFSSHVIIKNKNQFILFCIDFDLSEQKKSREKIKSLLNEKEILLQETHHRLKNNMSVLIGILSIESSKCSHCESQNILEDCINRIVSMSVLYDFLYRNQISDEMNLKLFLNQLVKKLKEIHQKLINLSVEIEVQDIKINTKYLSTIGIIINELFTNTIKYAFDRRDDCFIKIDVINENDVVSISFSDNGKGLPTDYDFEKSDSFGFKLIKMLVRQLSGTISINRKQGTKFTIIFNNSEI